MKNVLTIAGFDPSGGAGLQADLRTFCDLGVKGLSVATALTAQNGRKVRAVSHIPRPFIEKQLEVLAEEFSIDAVKIGMLGRKSTILAVESFLKLHPALPVVLDPVCRSTDGFALIDDAGMERIKSLVRLATVVTPNLKEAAILCGRQARSVKGMKEAATRIHHMGAPNVVVTGGHLEKSAVDILYNGTDFHYFKGRRLGGGHQRLHGTGCHFSSALAATLAKGSPMEEAVAKAKKYVASIIKAR